MARPKRKPVSRKPAPRILAHTGRDALSMARANLENATRVLAMLQGADCSGMCPHPAIIVQAEINNAMRHISLFCVVECE